VCLPASLSRPPGSSHQPSRDDATTRTSSLSSSSSSTSLLSCRCVAAAAAAVAMEIRTSFTQLAGDGDVRAGNESCNDKETGHFMLAGVELTSC